MIDLINILTIQKDIRLLLQKCDTQEEKLETLHEIIKYCTQKVAIAESYIRDQFVEVVEDEETASE